MNVQWNMDNKHKFSSIFYKYQPMEQIQLEPSATSSETDIILKESILNYQNNFQGQFSKCLIITKMKIAEQLKQLGSLASNKEMKIWIDSFKNKLKILNGNVHQLLHEGLLLFYLDIFELKANQTAFENTTSTHFIEKIIEIFAPLFRNFFINHEYTINKQSSMDDAKKKNISSFRTLKQNDKLKRSIKKKSTMETTLKEISKNLSNTPIIQLLEQYLENQKKQLHEALEICRICSEKIKVDSIEKHIKYCQEKFILKQSLDIINKKFEKILIRVKAEYKHLNLKSQKTEEEYLLKKMLQNVLNLDKKKEKFSYRRSSLATAKSQKDIKNVVSSKLKDYLEDHDNETFQQVIQLEREKYLIEQKLSSVEMNSLNSRYETSSQFKSEKKSIKSTFSISKASTKKIEDKNNAFHQVNDQNEPALINRVRRITEIKTESSQSNKHESQKQIEEEDCIILRTRTKKSTFSRWNYNQDIYDDKNSDHCFSLEDIIYKSDKDITISLQKFEILKFLGAGAFGKVYMAKRKQTNDIYALKIVKMSKGSSQKQIQTIKNQHQIFRKIAGDHLVKAPFSFSEGESHVFILEYLPGGDLGKLLAKEVYLEQDKAAFYLAEIVLAIEHLHNFQIIHRDLKPENLVIDKNGHLKLTDFGLSEIQINKKLQKVKKMEDEQEEKKKKTLKRRAGVTQRNLTIKLIGTPDYIAPEIISRLSINNFTIDWWSLGVMAYELLVGVKPFCAETIQEVVENISNFNIQWPEIGYEEGMMSPEAQDLITKLLNKNFMNRLGSKGAWEIKSHAFFSKIDWQNVKNATPPFIPPSIQEQQNSLLEEDPKLRKQVNDILGIDKQGAFKEKSLLERFVRFDLLGEETIENAEKTHRSKTLKIMRLERLNHHSLNKVL